MTKMDDWLLEHLAKVTTLSCILIIIYFLIYSTWRIAQMPNYPWNWQWPGRHAVEIIRKPTEMPFTLSLVENRKQDMDRCTFTLSYMKDREPPNVTLVWGASVPWIMKLVNSPWTELFKELSLAKVQADQWKCLLNSTSGVQNEGDRLSTMQKIQSLQCFVIEQYQVFHREENEIREKSPVDPILSEFYASTELVISPPLEFNWHFLKNQYRYPLVVFITNNNQEGIREDPAQHYFINGIIQIVHVKSETFPMKSVTLAQYIKMNNGQSHMLQSLYVMDDHRVGDDLDDNPDVQPEEERHQEPFGDILCSVCQVSVVTRVIIPCRHVCLCTQCFEKVEVCPICRGNIMYFFKTRTDSQTPPLEESPGFNWRQSLERLNYRFSDAMGLIRH